MPLENQANDPIASYTPNIFRPWMTLGEAVLGQKSFAPRNRELACLAVTAVFAVPYL